MNALISLAERCETAAGWDEALDIEILTTALGFRDIHGDGTLFDRGNDGYWVRPEYADAERMALPSPTSSLDAAMSLVPKGDVVLIANTGIDLSEADLSRGSAMVGPPNSTEGQPIQAATMALALCSAALRARAK